MHTIFFDLDGTLLPMNVKHFEKAYFSSLSAHIEDLLPKEVFMNALLESTKVMVMNTEPRTNKDVFMKHFETFVGPRLDIFEERFYDYYEGPYLSLVETTERVDSIIEDVRILKEKGYQLVLATNPMFPLKAIERRIAWAGLTSDDFVYVSCFEKNTHCKPQLGFYREILETLGIEGKDCMMVGNDVEEDLVAQRLGMKTYLIDTHKVQRNEVSFVPDYVGGYDDFHQMVLTMALAEHNS